MFTNNYRCCVQSCRKPGAIHRFPKPKTLTRQFKSWLEAIKDEELFSLSEQVVFCSYRICDAHFSSDNWETPQRIQLKSTAVPDQNLERIIVVVHDQIEEHNNVVSPEIQQAKKVKSAKIASKSAVGLNTQVFEILKETSKHLNSTDKKAILLWDEVKIQSSLSYDKKGGVIAGLEDLGNGPTKDAASHVLFFMLVGINKKWTLPLCYYFTLGINKQQLKQKLTTCFVAVQDCNIELTAIVCNNNPVNVNTIQEMEKELISFNIVPLYNVPLLLKSTRDYFAVNDVTFKWNSKLWEASWKYINYFYTVEDADLKIYTGEDEEWKCASKLTIAHIDPSQMDRESLSVAAQVFSRTLASLLMMCVRSGANQPNYEGTAHFLMFFDNLFDSLNGTNHYDDSAEDPEKPLRNNVSETSAHHDFWKSALDCLNSIRFGGLRAPHRFSPLIIKNWIVTLQGIQTLMNRLLLEEDIPSVNMRNFNLEPLEKFLQELGWEEKDNKHFYALTFQKLFDQKLVESFDGNDAPWAGLERDIIESLKGKVVGGSGNSDDT